MEMINKEICEKILLCFVLLFLMKIIGFLFDDVERITQARGEPLRPSCRERLYMLFYIVATGDIILSGSSPGSPSVHVRPFWGSLGLS